MRAAACLPSHWSPPISPNAAKFDAIWPDDLEICSCPADRTLLVVAGGPGQYSFISHTWQGGPHGTQPITRAFEPTPACED
ncbi:MAG: hypothetical protein AB7L65_04260 [Hyphomonadaceae bacterium]